MAAPNTSCPLFWPGSTPCSGNGECVDGLCICDPGYTSRGDFISPLGLDCDINIVAVRVLWAMMGISYAITLVRLSWKAFGAAKRLRQRSSGEQFKSGLIQLVREMRPVVIMSCLFISSSLQKVTSPTRVLAVDPVFTFTHSFAMAVFWDLMIVNATRTFSRLFHLIQNNVTSTAERLIGSLEDVTKVANIVSRILVVGACLSPIAASLDHSGTYYRAFLRLHYGGVLVGILVPVVLT